jgi:hypothetical protein
MNFASTKRGFVEPIDVDTINERPLTNLQLRVSDRCAITFDADGTAILFHFAQPNRHLALTEPERVLMSCFRADRYTVVESAVQALRRQKGAVWRQLLFPVNDNYFSRRRQLQTC